MMKEIVNVERVMSIYDSKSEVFLKPFVTRTFGEAERVFKRASNDKETAVGQYPEDHTLFHVADWDQRTGKMIEINAIRSLGTGINFVKPPEDADQHKMQLV